MAHLPDKDKLTNNFSSCLNWEEKYLYVIELGEKLLSLNDVERKPINLISGCQSQVWIVMYHDDQGWIEFHGDSDAAIVKGLLAMIFILYNSMTPEQIVTLDVRPFFNKLALGQHLTPSRSQGVEAMIQAIRSKASEMILKR